MANHKQAKKRAIQSERRRLRNMHVKTGVRSLVKRVRYSIDTINLIDAGRQVHPQEVEKHLRSILDRRSPEYRRFSREDVLTGAQTLLDTGRKGGKHFDRDMHRSFLEQLARADLYMASRSLDRAASKGVVHRRNASRRVSRLTLLVNGVSR